jgi:hypothetical protein
MRRDPERLSGRRIGALDDRHQFGGQTPVQRDVLLEQGERPAEQDLILFGEHRRGHRLDDRAQAVVARHVPGDAGARDPLDEHAHRASAEPRQLPDARDDSDPVEIGRRGLLGLRVALRDEQHEPILLVRGLERRQRRRPPDEERHDDVRKHHDVPQRQDREAVGGDEVGAVGGEGRHG